MADVSVVIPTRDRSHMLELALRTALYQRDVDLEVIVVDDGSTDDTAATVAGLSDPRVRLLRNRASEGVSAARNRGIEQAAGRWIAFLDDDDLWAPDKLARQLESARSSGRGWVYAGNVGVDSRLQILSGGPPPSPEGVVESIRRYNVVPAGASNVVVHRDLLCRVGRFDPALRANEDWDLWIRLAQAGPPASTRRPLVAYRFLPGPYVDPRLIVAEPPLLAARHGIPVDMAAMHRRAAWTCLWSGRRREALRYYARAVALGDAKSLGRAVVVALALPMTGADGVFRLRRPTPVVRRWRRDAQAWLDLLAVGVNESGEA